MFPPPRWSRYRFASVAGKAHPHSFHRPGVDKMRFNWILLSAFVLVAVMVSSASARCHSRHGGSCHRSGSYYSSASSSYSTGSCSSGSCSLGSTQSSVTNSTPVVYSAAKPVVENKTTNQEVEKKTAPAASTPAVKTTSAYTMPTQASQAKPYCPSCQLRN